MAAVITAFLVGIIGSLAVRPPGNTTNAVTQNAEGTAQQAPIYWRLPVVFQTTLPVLGDNPLYVADIIRRASGGAVQLDVFEPGEIVPAFSAARDAGSYFGCSGSTSPGPISSVGDRQAALCTACSRSRTLPGQS